MSRATVIAGRVLVAAVAAGACVAAAWYFEDADRPSMAAAATEKLELDRYFAARRGDFNITVMLDGTLDAIKRHQLKCEARGRHGLEIVHVVADGASVEAGDVVVRMSSDKYDEALAKLLLELEDDYKELRLEEEDLQMTQADNFNAIKFATDLVRAGREKLKRYEEEDAPRKKRDLMLAITTAEEDLSRTERKLADKRAALSDASLQNRKDVAELEKEVQETEQELKKARASVEKAQYALRVFKRYEHPQEMRTRREVATKNEMELQRDLVRATSMIIKGEREVDNRRARVEKRLKELEELRDDVEKLVVTAPVAGIVSLGNPSRRRRGQPKEIIVGASVSQGEVLGTIPDLSQFKVDVDVPEEYRSKIAVGQEANLRSRAMADLRLKGRVESISPMARNIIHWDENSPKVYAATISADSADPRLMPGMTMSVETITARVVDVLYVPVEAVYNRDGRIYCKVRGDNGLEERAITAGRSSDDYVEVQSGLVEGEQVLLHADAGSS